jgi:hypothetical protein
MLMAGDGEWSGRKKQVCPAGGLNRITHHDWSAAFMRINPTATLITSLRDEKT